MDDFNTAALLIRDRKIQPLPTMTTTKAYNREKAQYLQHFRPSTDPSARSGNTEEIRMTPLFTLSVQHAVDRGCQPRGLFPQFGLLGKTLVSVGKDANDTYQASLTNPSNPSHPFQTPDEEPIFLNTNAPNSVFLCGSQGSGKSYTLTCLLEACLRPAPNLITLPQPLSALVFHYDANGGGTTSTVAEAASLAAPDLPVRVLVPTSNYHALRAAYAALPAGKHITVSRLTFHDGDLNAERMLRLMAFSDSDGPVPLYMEVVQRILRQRAMDGKPFCFADFEAELDAEALLPGQRNMMDLRFDLLKSFLAEAPPLRNARAAAGRGGLRKGGLTGGATPFVPVKKAGKGGSDGESSSMFATKPGTLTIMDLSDPFIDPATACVLFDVCLGLAKQFRPPTGMVLAIDEAHKFLGSRTAGAAKLTEQLVLAIREQRHNAMRVFIATQEPTVSETLLDLCSISIVHRFSSPAWFGVLEGHLGGASKMVVGEVERREMFEAIGGLGVGEALVFSPASFVRVRQGGQVGKLGAGFVRMLTRSRVGVDAGRSEMAVG
ncbi:hypothetical protein B0A50_08788 [Salinomyces thailandicus]|uniref:AAA+ ATPase domain-containing protein n=1 Tax=Salinomyces thailandicus TaxID=706561 RepID=A0A4U0TIZ2_9PEZI|nr:hypothetical protein B0A50_08788 [Salinomyces thailandica]